jgi:hypothetical protein
VTTYDPTSGLGTLANSVSSQTAPIVIEVATAMIGLTLLFWGVRYVLRFIKSRH